MTLPDPATARHRSDLPYLRSHSKRTAPKPVTHIDVTHHDKPASSLDLSAPAPTPTPPVSSSLDLSAPAPAPKPTVSSSLDLSTPAAPTRPKPVAPRRRHQPKRAPSGTQTLLTAAAPTVTLNRLQSGIGTLTIEAAVSAAVGDLRLGAAYVLAGGQTSTIQHEGGNRNGPSDARSPVLQAQKHQYETVAVDLRRLPDVQRVMVFAYSATRVPLQWAGTVVTTTYADASLECPLEIATPSPVAVLLSAYHVGGELVIRRELNGTPPTVKAACLAYGYDRIAWLDDWTPIP